MTRVEKTRCTRCLYSDKNGECKKGKDVCRECMNDRYSWFERKYIENNDGKIIYSEEFEEDKVDDELWYEMCLNDPNLSEQ